MANEPERHIKLDDPRAMRALAHPTRLRILGELRARGPQNVGMLSEVIDEAPGSISYHLSTLAKYGLVLEAPEKAASARERWWKAAHQRTVWDPVALAKDPDLRVAGEMLERTILRRWFDKLERYVEAEPTLEPGWIEAAVSSDTIVHLTSGELAELRDELKDLALRWEARSDRDRDGAAQVTLLYHAFRSDS
jgi:DNA-binding transcriptional ArsR family regulator